MSDDPLVDEVRELRHQVHVLEVEQKGEIVRRQGETSAVKDALVDVKSALNSFAQDSKDIKGMFAEARTATARLETRVDEMRADMVEWKAQTRAQIESLHGRISSVGREARAENRASEDRVQVFLHRWLPIIIGGIVGGMGLAIGVKGGV